jgi:hypothetical protein
MKVNLKKFLCLLMAICMVSMFGVFVGAEEEGATPAEGEEIPKGEVPGNVMTFSGDTSGGEGSGGAWFWRDGPEPGKDNGSSEEVAKWNFEEQTITGPGTYEFTITDITWDGLENDGNPDDLGFNKFLFRCAFPVSEGYKLNDLRITVDGQVISSEKDDALLIEDEKEQRIILINIWNNEINESPVFSQTRIPEESMKIEFIIAEQDAPDENLTPLPEATPGGNEDNTPVDGTPGDDDNDEKGEKEDKDNNNIFLFIGIGAGVVLLGIIIAVIAKKKG